MSDFLNLALFAALIFALVLGAGLVPFASSMSAQPKTLYRMTCVAAGFLISAALLIAIPEGFILYFEHAQMENGHGDDGFASYLGQWESSSGHGHGVEHASAIIAGLAVLLGFVFMMVLESFGFGHDVHEEHHDHVLAHSHDHVNHPAEHSSSLVIGLTIHAVADGVVLAAAFSLGELVLSLQLAAVVLMHKFPAAFSLSAYSLHERENRKKSLLDLLLFASATPAAMLLSFFLFEPSSSAWQGLAVLFAAGGFIYVSAVDVLPTVHIREKSKQSLAMVLLGIVMMLGISFGIQMFFPEAQIH